jgi:hypothetical protein
MRHHSLSLKGAFVTALLTTTCAFLNACAGDDAVTAPTVPAFVEGAGHNSVVQIRETQPVSFEVENPCNGEVIVFTGTEDLQGTLIGPNPESGATPHNHFNSQVDATGTGPVSGATYSIHDIFSQNFQSPSGPAPQFTASLHESLNATTSVPGLSFRFKLLVHVVLNPSLNEFKLTKELEEATCRG